MSGAGQEPETPDETDRVVPDGQKFADLLGGDRDEVGREFSSQLRFAQTGLCDADLAFDVWRIPDERILAVPFRESAQRFE
jgi:hypothetical protein